MQQDITKESYQAKVLGELFKSYGLNQITPVPSTINYQLAISLMKTKGDKHARHFSK